MTLLELSREYRYSAELLKGRIRELRHRYSTLTDEDARRSTEARLRVLTAMLREAGELAVLCERYYERGYRRNGKYTL